MPQSVKSDGRPNTVLHSKMYPHLHSPDNLFFHRISLPVAISRKLTWCSAGIIGIIKLARYLLSTVASMVQSMVCSSNTPNLLSDIDKSPKNGIFSFGHSENFSHDSAECKIEEIQLKLPDIFHAIKKTKWLNLCLVLSKSP